MSRTELEKEITEIAQLLYQQKEQEGYNRIAALIPGLTQYIDQIADEKQQSLVLSSLKEMLEAMEQQDMTLLADVLSYELLENL